jgi:hypothetical protein
MNIPLQIYRLSAFIQNAIWLVLCYAAFQKRWFWKAHYRYFYWFLLVITFLEITTTIFAFTERFRSNNLFLGYLYAPCEFIFLGLFLQGIIKNRYITIFAYVASFLFVTFELFKAFWDKGYLHHNNLGNTILNLYLIALSLWAYTTLFKEVDGKNIFKNPVTWFVLGILLIYATDTLTDLLYGIAIPLKNDNILYGIRITHNFLQCSYLLLYLKGIKQIQK